MIVACRGLANSATAGSAGASLVNYTLPIANNFGCAPLPASNLKYFKGRLASGTASLQWEVRDESISDQYILERSTDGENFLSLLKINNTGKRIFTEKDPLLRKGINYYRLKILYKNGTTEFSPVIRISNDLFTSSDALNLQPNADKAQLLINFKSSVHSHARLILFKPTGEKINEQSINVRPGINAQIMNISGLPSGTYVLCVQTEYSSYSKKFLLQK